MSRLIFKRSKNLASAGVVKGGSREEEMKGFQKQKEAVKESSGMLYREDCDVHVWICHN